MTEIMIRIECIREPAIALRSVDRECEHYKMLLTSIKNKTRIPGITARWIKSTQDYPGHYEIIDGLARFTAYKELRHISIPVYSVDCESDEDMMIMQIMLSKSGKPVTPQEYSRQLKRLINYNPLITLAELAVKISRSTHWIVRILSLHNMCPLLGQYTRDGSIKLINAYGLNKLPKSEQVDWIHRAQILKPDVFIPLINRRGRELFRERKCTTCENNNEEFAGIMTVEGVWYCEECYNQWVHGYGKQVARHTEAGELELTGDKVTVVDEHTIHRKGWDNVVIDGKLAYLHDEILITFTGKWWTIQHPVLKTLTNESYKTPLEAMEIVEEHLDPR